jgi:hypothetical protein
MLINKTTNNYLQFDGIEKYICGNVDRKIILENKKNDITNPRIRVLDKPYTGQLYFDHYYKHPITPIEDDNMGIEKWQFSQPLSYNRNINGEYPIRDLNDDKLIKKYDNPDMYRRIFFNQNDGRR